MKKIIKLKNEFIKWNPSIYVKIILFIIPFFVFTLTKFKLDNDFWFLTNTGKYILNNGFITVEPFTMHTGLSFIPQQWLTTIIFYLIYNNFGIIGMFIFEIIMNCLIIYLIFQILKLICKNEMVNIFTTVFVDICLIIFNVITSRPQMFDILIFLLLLYLLENYIKKNQTKYLYFLPLISVLLINLHASMWTMFFVILIPYYFEYIFKKIQKEESYRIKPMIIATIISLLSGLLNPYHINSILYLFKSYGVKEINNIVGEMIPANISTSLSLYIIIFVLLLIIYKNKGNNIIRYVLLFLGTSYLSLSHYRGILFLLLSSILLIGNCFNDNINYKKYNLMKYEKIIYICIIITVSLFTILNIEFDRSNKLDQIVEYLDNNKKQGIVLYTEYDDGGYFEYRGYRTYIDPRAEVFLKSNNKKKDIMKEYYNLRAGKLSAKEFLNKYNFDYLIVFNDNYFLLNELERNNDYIKVNLKKKSNGYRILYEKKTKD